ncbi:probable metal-nicotianamine transporter YSL9 [Lolium perenne]|uniref:probable metal-nicotianamine transporter YSL9 n=1 Tax=Lolium perenne TaxID=4522 RepID=UPI0021F68992|nr:probable metal-nicotianamine transporter YSL9 [Lolium perenne]
MALRQRDAAGEGKEEPAELYGDGDGDGAEAGQPAHARGPVPKWSEQLTARGLVVAATVGIMYSVIVMKLNLTTGLDPTLNVSAALISFVILRVWTQATARLGFAVRPLTRQENTVIQTCAVACYGISSAGGFGSYLLGLSKKTYEAAGTDIEGNVGWKEPGIGWMTGYLFAVSFVGILALVPLRKILVIDYKLTYPSGTATAVLINGFHAPQGDDVAKMQVKGFTKYFVISFFWSFFQWFYSGGDKCGFSQFPTLGLRARKQTFFFDFNLTYVGAGMICPHLINISLLLGSILSYGIMWPLISDLKGNWYPADLPESSMRSLQGYKAFICIALILGDGMYNFAKIIVSTIWSIVDKSEKKKTKKEEDILSLDDLHRNEVFTRESLPNWIAFLGYFGLSLVAVITIPLMFPEIKWYYAIIAYILAPALGFSNAYGSGLTDINMAFNYGKVALLILAATAGKEHGVVAGMVGCGMVKSIASISSDLMQDFKTGHLTLTSPRSMLIAQIVGTIMGCVIAPLAFFVFYNAFDIGNLNGPWKAPYALIYRNIAILGVEGFSALPKHCLQLCCGFFAFALVANLMRDFLPRKYGKWIPLPMAMGFPFLVGASFAIDMCVGTLIVYIWHKIDKSKAVHMVPAVASGFICGDGLWIFPASLLSLAKITPPMCMAFESTR